VANTILTANFSQPQFVATNETLNVRVWEGIAVVNAEVSPSAAVTELPLAIDGPKDSPTTAVIQAADLAACKVIQPVRLRVEAVMSDLSLVEAIIGMLEDDVVMMSVVTKSIITKNLILTEVNVLQSAEMTSAVRVQMSFEQAQPPVGEGYNPEQPADGSMYGAGVQSLSEVQSLGSLTKTVASSLSRPVIKIFGPLIDGKGGPFILDRSPLA